MENIQPDTNMELMLDGNAVGGMLQEIFAGEMTAVPGKCAQCGNEAEIGELLAFTHAPGVVLRCPACESVVLRIVKAPDGIYLDARGAAFLRMTYRDQGQPG